MLRGMIVIAMQRTGGPQVLFERSVGPMPMLALFVAVFPSLHMYHAEVYHLLQNISNPTLLSTCCSRVTVDGSTLDLADLNYRCTTFWYSLSFRFSESF